MPNSAMGLTLAELPRGNKARFKKTILMIDHDVESVDSLSRWFEREGYGVTTAFHPFHGLAKATEQRFDVAILDVHTPDVDGIDLLQELIGLHAFPVIVIAKQPEAKLIKKVKALGAFTCLSKPVVMESLKASIEQAVVEFSCEP